MEEQVELEEKVEVRVEQQVEEQVEEWVEVRMEEQAEEQVEEQVEEWVEVRMEKQVEEWTDLGAELGQLVGLSVEPAQGLHVLEVGVGGQALGAEVLYTDRGVRATSQAAA